MDTLKLQVGPRGLAATASTTNNCPERVQLAPDGRALCVELVNRRVTLLKSVLLTHHRVVESITRGLIALTVKRPHRCNGAKAHELRSKLRENTDSENSSSPSIIIAPLSVSRQIISVDRKGI
jgi:hypothetical protein